MHEITSGVLRSLLRLLETGYNNIQITETLPFGISAKSGGFMESLYGLKKIKLSVCLTN
jgi:hypothetical protein